MTETLPDIETRADVLILESLDFEPSCQHSQHSDPMWRHHHSGPAKWMRFGMCPKCPVVVHDLICDPWKRMLEDNPDGMLRCAACDEPSPWKEFGFKFTPILEVR